MRLELDASSGALRLAADETGWCQVELHIGDRRVALGADVLHTVLARLAGGLGDVLVGKGTIEGVAVCWIASFFEQHCTIYGGDVDNSRRLYFQDRDAKIFATMTLSQEERLRWLSALRALSPSAG
jgi:hypothetical protein